MPSLPTGTVTFLFTDIEGSTRLLQQLSDAYADVLTECRRLVRAAVQERGGQEVDTEGDAVFAAFASAREALMAAVTSQQRILRHPRPDGAAVRVRMVRVGPRASPGREGYCFKPTMGDRCLRRSCKRNWTVSLRKPASPVFTFTVCDTR
jgi:hypothetical protein